jgi:hypothetical protein
MTKAEEVPKRLAPTQETLRALFLKSGNLCAYPGCAHLMMNADGVFVGQICHIEAAEKGGPRFNASSTNEERRRIENLMLMCHAHHKVTDKVSAYPVIKLREMKERHESRFSSPERAMLGELKDWTKATEPTLPENLGRLHKVLRVQLDEEDAGRVITEFRDYVKRFKRVPLESREFLRAVAQRTYDMRKTNAVTSYGWSHVIRTDDLKGALQISDNVIKKRADSLSSYSLGDIVEMEDENSRNYYGVSLNSLDPAGDIWMGLAKFCAKTGIDLASLAIDMDFAQLDD